MHRVAVPRDFFFHPNMLEENVDIRNVAKALEAGNCSKEAGGIDGMQTG